MCTDVSRYPRFFFHESSAELSSSNVIFLVISLYLGRQRQRSHGAKRERERDESSGLCEWITGDIYSWTQKLREASGIKRRNCCYVRIVVLVRSCRTMKLYGVRNVNKSEKRREFIPGPFFSTFAFATFWADYKNTRRQIRKEKRNVENLFFFSLSRPSTIQII